MQFKFIRGFLRVILPFLILVVGCNSKSLPVKTIISVKSLGRATLDQDRGYTLLQLLNVYPAQMDCTGSKRYANLYICKRFVNGDTVCVFEECNKVQSFALDTSYNYAAVIDKENIIDKWPDQFTFFVPGSFRMPKEAKCFFARLRYLTEY